MVKLEKADQAFCFTSGMAALTTVTHLVEAGVNSLHFSRHIVIMHNRLTTLVPAGQEIVAGDDIYGGSDRLLSHVAPKRGVIVKLVCVFFFSYPYTCRSSPILKT